MEPSGAGGTVATLYYASSHFCPRCDMQLAARYGPVGFGGYRTTLACENCNWASSEIEGELNEIISRVERLIQRKLRSGEYKALTHEDR